MLGSPVQILVLALMQKSLKCFKVMSLRSVAGC